MTMSRLIGIGSAGHFAMPKEAMLAEFSKHGAVVLVPRHVRSRDGDEINEGIRQIEDALIPLLGNQNFYITDRYVFDNDLEGKGMHVWVGIFETEADAMVFKLRFSEGEEPIWHG